MRTRISATAILLVSLAGCAPELGAPPSLIDGVRVLAVRGEPAEVAPGAAAEFEALVVDESGVYDEAPIWSFCVTPKPPTEDNVVAVECLGDGVREVGSGRQLTATIPADACSLFGPEPPGPGLRPRDPDVTGGYYQPIRLEVGGEVAFGLERIRCNLAQAPLRVAQAYRERYVENQNPTVEPPESMSVKPGASVTWSAPVSGAEDYVRYDPQARSLVDARETLTVSWFATAGALASDQTDASDLASVVWTAPADAQTVRLFAVVRDSRGGVAWAEWQAEVQP